MAEFVPYDDKRHRTQFFDLYLEYATWFRNEVIERYGRDPLAGIPPIREWLENVLPPFLTELKSPEGVMYILEVDGKMVGIGALRRLEEGVAEVKSMYIQPDYRGYGYGKQMLNKLIESAKVFGYATILLDTVEFMAAARRIYESAGFNVRGPYPGTTVQVDDDVHIFMEKKL
jgi:GNAT superfamily N-acetyltransferase